MLKRAALLGLVIVGTVGALNAGYLALLALSGAAPNCNFIQGCDIVSASPHSKVFGIPLSLFGVFFYTSVVGLSIWGWFSKERIILFYIFVLSTLGLILSLYFLYLQAYVIKAFCEYCLFSLIDAIGLFIISSILVRQRDAKKI